jgi:hypothetical protein
MTYRELDFIFPFVVFGYGAVMCFVLNHPRLMALAEEKFTPEFTQTFKAKRALGLICLVVGGLWSLQNIWLN